MAIYAVHLDLRARVNRTILKDLEQKVFALRGLHLKMRDLDAGEKFGGPVSADGESE